MRRSTVLVAAVLLAGCSGGEESNRGPRDAVRPPAGPLSAADSEDVVRAAVTALHGSGGRRFEVAQFERADSGYLVSLLPIPSKDPRVHVAGGGGLVLVNSRRETRVIRVYR
jgi:hypothetical protein